MSETATGPTTPKPEPRDTKTATRRNTRPVQSTWVYIGPSLPAGALREGAVFRGTRNRVLAHLAPVIERYPQVPVLVVATDRLAEYKTKLVRGGNRLRRAYDELAAGGRREEE